MVVRVSLAVCHGISAAVLLQLLQIYYYCQIRLVFVVQIRGTKGSLRRRVFAVHRIVVVVDGVVWSTQQSKSRSLNISLHPRSGGDSVPESAISRIAVLALCSV